MKQEVLTLRGVNANQLVNNFYHSFRPKSIITKRNFHVYVLEKYYYRTSSEVAATIIFELIDQNFLKVHIIIAGGSDMFGFTLGAQNSMLKRIKKNLMT